MHTSHISDMRPTCCCLVVIAPVLLTTDYPHTVQLHPPVTAGSNSGTTNISSSSHSLNNNTANTTIFKVKIEL